MSPDGQVQVKQVKIPDNIYTVILGVACGAVVAVTVFVLIECYGQYGVIFTMP